MGLSRLSAASRPRTSSRTDANVGSQAVNRRAVATALLAFGALCGIAAMPPVAAVLAASAKESLVIETASGASPLNFSIEVARSPREKALGLMFRRELPALHGMLFPYPAEQEVTMWMKNTYIPLDMLFIKADGEILRIEEMTEPFSERVIRSGGPVAGVLEIAGGDARRLGIARGDKVRHSHFAASTARP